MKYGQHNGQKKKVQKDKYRSTKHTHKTKNRVTRTPLKTGGELRWSGRVGSTCSTSGTHRVNLVTNPNCLRIYWISVMYGCYYLTKSIKQSTQLETAADTLLRSNLNMMNIYDEKYHPLQKNTQLEYSVLSHKTFRYSSLNIWTDI